MANEKNLIPQNKRTKSEQREIARKGGIRSGEVRRENKLIRKRILERTGEDDWNTMIDNLVDRAKVNTKAFEVLRDTIGQKPTSTIEVQDDRIAIEVHVVE